MAEAARDKLAAETGAKKGRTGTPTSARGEPFKPSPTSSTSQNHTIAQADTKRWHEHTARDQRKSRTISLNSQSAPSLCQPQSHRHSKHGLSTGQEGHSSDTSHQVMELFASPSASRVMIPGTESGPVCTDQPCIPQRGRIMSSRYNGAKYIYRMDKSIGKDEGASCPT